MDFGEEVHGRCARNGHKEIPGRVRYISCCDEVVDGGSNGVVMIGCQITLPLTSPPEHISLKNNWSAKLDPKLVGETITELCQSGWVVECSVPPVVINPLSVAV